MTDAICPHCTYVLSALPRTTHLVVCPECGRKTKWSYAEEAATRAGHALSWTQIWLLTFLPTTLLGGLCALVLWSERATGLLGLLALATLASGPLMPIVGAIAARNRTPKESDRFAVAFVLVLGLAVNAAQGFGYLVLAERIEMTKPSVNW